MKSRVLVVASYVIAFLVPITSHGQRSTWLSAAVDAKGVRHRGSDYPGRAPWMNDVIHMVKPDYPYAERAQHHQGSGLLRLELDMKTGSVTRIAIVTSTGYTALDSCATTAFYQWRWKPGRWKEIDVPMTFTFGREARMSIGPPWIP
jgi:TonB family protein